MQHLEKNNTEREYPSDNPFSSHDTTNLARVKNLDENPICLLDYLEVLASNWRMIAKTTIVAAILSVVYSISLPNIYCAKTLILPPQQDSSGLMGMLMGASGGMGGMAVDLLGKGTPADMYVGILNSEAVSDKIIDRFKLMDVYKLNYRMDAYKKLDSTVDIAVGKKAGIITITVDDINPKRAADIANAYVDELCKLTAKLNITGAGYNRAFYEERLAKAKVDLTVAEDSLKLFQVKYKALDITEQARGTIKGIADLEAQLALEEVKLAGLKQSLTDSSSEIRTQSAIIANLKAQISKFEGNRTGSSFPGVASVPELGQQYLRLMREFKIHETIVELLTKQYETAKLSEAKDITAIQVIQSAKVPDKKSKPNRSLIVLAITLAAGFGAGLYSFISEAGVRMPDEDRVRWHRIMALMPDISCLMPRKKNRSSS